MNNRKMLGDLGEQLVAQLEHAILSENVYDSEKDMIDINGKKIEVKTQNRDHFRKCFSIEALGITNVKKCLTVDRLIFVEYDNTSIIKIFECIDKNSVFTYTTSSNKKMYGFPISKMKLLYYYDNNELANSMRNLTNSKYIGAK